MTAALLPSSVTRRGLRRLFVIAAAGLLGLGVPQWVPRLLATLPAFRVEHVTIVGTRYVPADEINQLIALEPDASVWDRVDGIEDRIRQHPMIREAAVRRDGLRALSVVVVEKRPVALVATPELRAVNGEGRVLPLEPFEAGLDLPVIQGVTTLEDDLVSDPDIREMASVLDRLGRADPGFISVVSQVESAPDGYGFFMLPAADAGVVLLPRDETELALRRVSLALGQAEEEKVARADARFPAQVVLTPVEGR